MNKTEIGDMIQKYRKLKGMTQEELAKVIGVSRATLANYERGNREPSFDTIEKFVTTLNIPSTVYFKNIDTSEDVLWAFKNSILNEVITLAKGMREKEKMSEEEINIARLMLRKKYEEIEDWKRAICATFSASEFEEFLFEIGAEFLM